MGMTGKLHRISMDTLEGMIESAISVTDFIFDEEQEQHALDIDKAWHAIHYLLNGSDWEGELPMFNVILGGTELEENAGCGPIRYLTNEEVKGIASAMAEISVHELKERFKPEAMNELEIYPSWDWRASEEWTYIFDYYKEVRDYYAEAARNNDAMLLYLM
ncbi:YfbM family protein [Paenibacillus dendritiformis]|uniref:YfbM family protein n=1 Tax=Paenibacillus dendritiformis TaxID=130049 RepID=UPI000DA7A0D5|nr:YfbM family protein [Paenibacillus dendritiformis]PZM66290.1 hypothetical protein DOE73_07495 [Paenibacillus dendritiformis]